jgi:DNA-binding PadR family transcriptional regulator
VTAERELAPGEWSVLALLCEEPAHGWALAAAVAPDGEIGAVWSLGRPLVYRSLEILQQRGLIEPAGSAPSVRGPSRTLFRPTRKGRKAVSDWLAEPVAHVRDVRPMLLLKLVFGRRAGVDQDAMLSAQYELLAELTGQFEGELVQAEGTEELLQRFQLENARAALRFVGALKSVVD